MRKSYALVAVLALAFMVSACQSKGTSTAPSPNPSPNPTPQAGPVVVGYNRAAAGVTHCLSAGSSVDRCDSPVKTGSVSWPYGYGLAAQMSPQPDGTFKSPETMAPVASGLGVSVIDPWLCPPDTWICDNPAVTGRGISVNDTRLKDGKDVTYFSFTGTTVVPQ